MHRWQRPQPNGVHPAEGQRDGQLPLRLWREDTHSPCIRLYAVDAFHRLVNVNRGQGHTPNSQGRCDTQDQAPVAAKGGQDSHATTFAQAHQ